MNKNNIFIRLLIFFQKSDIEEMCILGIGLCVSGFAFKRSSSNRHLSNSKIAFHVQEVRQDNPESIENV